jgi:Fungal specific transcription factor domain
MSNHRAEATAQQSPVESLANQVMLRQESDRSPHDRNGDDSHFVGDLNPEGTLLAAATNPQAVAAAATDKVGVWLTGDNYREPRAGQLSSITPYCPDPLIANLFPLHIEDQCIRLLPESFPILSEIYFDEIHPHFPVVDITRFNALQDASPAKVLLKQAICLAASTQIKAPLCLKFQGADRPASPREFAERITAAIRTGLDMELVRDRQVRIQVFTLLSLFTQFWNDRHMSADLCARAIALVQTVGLHLPSSAIDSAAEHQAYRNRLLLCVWGLDRLNAAFHGRAVMLHERDFGWDLETIVKEQDSPFQLILRTLLVLDKVIALYRPDSSANHQEWEGRFPSFEELVEASGSFGASRKEEKQLGESGRYP